MVHKRFGGVLGVFTTVGLLAGAFISPAIASPPSEQTTTPGALLVQTGQKSEGERTSTVERQRVDGVVTPKPRWFNCSTFAAGAQCASIALPLDYDKPRGAKTEVAVLRIKAKNQKNRIGTLFLNPGGPGASGILIAADAPRFLDPKILERFDIVGFDPRGVNFSDNVRCWENLGMQKDALAGMEVPYPAIGRETRAYVKSSEAFGKACATTGKPLSASMSTAQVARDMDVLRRMVGDKQLSYLGFSYGSYLGTVYANMFPDRVRAVAIDGVFDPVAWAGTPATAGIPQTQRIKSGEAAEKVMRSVLDRCKKAGKDYCMLAEAGDPEKNYRSILAQLKAKPLLLTDEETGEVFFTLTEAILIPILNDQLYSPYGSYGVDMILSDVLYRLNERAAVKPTMSVSPQPKASLAAKKSTAHTFFVSTIRKFETQEKVVAQNTARKAAASGFAFPYDNSVDAFQSVLCTDGKNPSKAKNWSQYAADANAVAPGFGPLWTWASAPCATSTWKAQDEDSYTGPFTRRTSNPLLVVGNYWDPATNYSGAKKVAKLMPNSRLLSSDSWGHTAYGTSKCVTDAITGYLMTKELPATGKLCIGDVKPFTERLDDFGNQRRRSAPERELPPVVPPLPGAVPRS